MSKFLSKTGAAIAAMTVVSVGVGSASAIEMSAGISGAFRSNFGSGLEAEWCEPGWGCEKEEEKYDWLGGGFNAFFDVTYAEFNVGMTFSSHSKEESYNYGTEWGKYKFTLSLTSLDIGVFGKYPIDLGGITLFPMAGIDYRLVISGTYTNEESGYDEWEGNYSYKSEGDLGERGAPDAGDFSRLWIKFGLGMDIPLNETMFIRPRILYGIGLASKYENDQIDRAKEWGSDVNAILSHGLDIRVGVGLKF